MSPMQFCDLSAVRPELPLPCFDKGVAVVGLSEGGFGYLNSQGHVLALTTQAGAFQRQDGALLICVVSNRVGFIDREGQTVVLTQYEAATPFRGGRAAVRQGDQWGLIDAQGNWMVKPAFERLRVVSGDARVWSYRAGERWGLIDRTGEKLSNALYLDVGTLSGSAIAVQGTTGWGLVSEGGVELVKLQYAGLFPFEKDTSLWMAQSSVGKWGVVSTNGQERVMCSFDYIVAATAEIWLAQQSGLWGILDPKTGRWRVPAVFNRILPMEAPFKNIVLVEQGGRWGVIDGETGKTVIETRYPRIGQWGAFIAIKDGRMMKLLDTDLRDVLAWEGAYEGLPAYDLLKGDSGVLVTADGATRITQDGKLPWDVFFEEAGAWSDGFLSVKRKGRWGLVSELGEWVLDPAFESIGLVAEGVVPVCEDEQWGLIRMNGKAGKRIFTTVAEQMGRPWRGLVPVKRGGRWGLIDFEGNTILPCEYDTLEWSTDEAGRAQFYGIDPVQLPELRFYDKPSVR